MAYQMAQILMTLSEFEGHFCCYTENVSCGPSASAEFFVQCCFNVCVGCMQGLMVQLLLAMGR